MKIVIGSDHRGVEIKRRLTELIRSMNHEVLDIGTEGAESVDYPDFAYEVAKRVGKGEMDRGILICGTGIGMSITANKVRGVRAAQAHDVYSAERARKSNDAQVLTMGARVIGTELAKAIVRTWLESEFAGGASERKVAKIKALDSER